MIGAFVGNAPRLSLCMVLDVSGSLLNLAVCVLRRFVDIGLAAVVVVVVGEGFVEIAFFVLFGF